MVGLKAFCVVFLLNFFLTRGISVIGLKFEEFSSCLLGSGIDSNSIVIRSNSSVYDFLNYQWQLKPPFPRPLAFIVPHSERDVKVTVYCGNKYGIHLMPKGGGHSLEKFSFGDDQTVIVDLREMTRLKINKKEGTASIGSGWLIGPLYSALWKEAQVFTSLGVCPTVGVSGVTTGGGYGFFHRQYGLAVDNVMEMKVVTADGQLLSVNSTNNSDLFWALRGGVGSSFGIITEFLFKIYPAPPKLFYGSLQYDISQFVDVFMAWQTFVKSGPHSVSAYVRIGSGLLSVEFGDTRGDPSEFQALLNSFPPTNFTKQAKLLEFPEFLYVTAKKTSGEVFPSDVPSDLRKLQRTDEKPGYGIEKAFFVKKELKEPKEIMKFKKLVEEVIEGSNVGFTVESSGGAVNVVPANETAFVHRDSLYILSFGINMGDPSVITPTLIASSVQLMNKVWETGKEIFNHNESYQNYVSLDYEDYLERYYGTNLPRLIGIKQKYDPDNYFHFPQSIPTYSELRM